MNGANIGAFDSTTPADTESVGLSDDRQRSTKTTFQQVLNDEHNFPAAGGSVVGYHLLGSARPFYGPQSTVSSSGTDGRVMIASDTSRLFGVGSAGTVLLGGGPNALSIGSAVAITFPQRAFWVEELGLGIIDSSGSTTITFPNSGYSGAPFVFTSDVSSTQGNGTYIISVPLNGITSTTAQVRCLTSATGTPSGTSGTQFFWRSVGTRAL